MILREITILFLYCCGFSITGGKDQCGSVLRNSTGEIETPDTDHDGSYDNGLNCNWTIETEQDKIIWLFVKEFDVEKEEQCRHDYMKVYDGIDATYPLFGTYCGDLNDELSSIPRKFGSSSNYLHIQFTSDATVTGAGVRALFLSAAGDSWKRWPDGDYSILMSVYGCPDQELNEWKHGYFNITVSSSFSHDLFGRNNRNKLFKWRDRDLLLLGPYGKHFFQLNFCTKERKSCDPRDDFCRDDVNFNKTEEWPSGEYIIFATGIENGPKTRLCPRGI